MGISRSRLGIGERGAPRRKQRPSRLRRQVHVRRQVQRLDGDIEIRLPKYNSERTVHVPDALLQMLSEHVALGLPYDWLFAESDDLPAAPEHRRTPVAQPPCAGPA